MEPPPGIGIRVQLCQSLYELKASGPRLVRLVSLSAPRDGSEPLPSEPCVLRKKSTGMVVGSLRGRPGNCWQDFK